MCKSIIFPLFFDSFILRQVNLFSIMKSVRCCPFLFDVLYRLYLLCLFFPIWAFISPPMISRLCFGMLEGIAHRKKVVSLVSSLILVGL